MFVTLRRVVERFDGLGLEWVLGGSLASMAVGEPRSTNDIDMVVSIESGDVDELVAAFAGEFYVDRQMIVEAIASGHSFNLLDLAAGIKVDIFVKTDFALDVAQFERRFRTTLGEGPARVEVWIGSAEDQILRKLWWFRKGGEVSDRQWRDLEGIMAVQGGALDREYIVSTARSAGLVELAARLLDGNPE